MPPVTDDFNRSDGGLGANWTSQNNAPAISANEVVGATASAQHHVFYTARTFKADQYAEVRLTADGFGGPSVRCAGTGAAADNYFVTADAFTDSCALYKLVDGSPTLIVDLTGGVTISVGDVIGLRVTGTTLQIFQNGSQIGTNQTDATHSTGQPGFQKYSNSGAVDDWGADGAVLTSADNALLALMDDMPWDAGLPVMADPSGGGGELASSSALASSTTILASG